MVEINENLFGFVITAPVALVGILGYVAGQDWDKDKISGLRAVMSIFWVVSTGTCLLLALVFLAAGFTAGVS